MIDYGDCMFMTYSYHGVTNDTLQDLKDLFLCRGRVTGLRPWHVSQNKVVQRYLEFTDKAYLVMVAADLLLDKPQLNAMLEAAETHDVVGTSFMQEPGRCIHKDEDTVPGSCLVIKRGVLESRPQGQWFFWGMPDPDDPLARVSCDCNWFCGWVKEKGYSIAKVGRVGHMTLTTI